MKHLIKLSSILTLLVAFSVINLFAQDTVKVKNQKGIANQEKNQAMEKNQAQESSMAQEKNKNLGGDPQQTKTQHGNRFVDLDGDGYNDNAPDQDGDGIPNGLDEDYVGANKGKNKFVDLDGDGINDNAGKGKNNKAKMTNRKGIGPKNGTGSGVGNGNGAGNGAGDGTGQGTAPKGQKGKGSGRN
ncbi:MAG: hypothetical protein GXX85_15420 [Ignavibacteria bacterium]|nr:hypothetical protein [Ignavibacteria bacterium]